MAKKDRKPPKRLFKGVEKASSYEHALSPMSRIKRVSGGQEALLKAVESVLVRNWKRNPGVDDTVVREALHAARTGRTPAEPRAEKMYRELAEARAGLTDVADAVWLEAIRLVAESIERHSGLRPGDVGYLEFAAQFLPEVE